MARSVPPVLAGVRCPVAQDRGIPFPPAGDARSVDGMTNQRPQDDDEADRAPLGGDQTTEDQLEADNAVEEDSLKTLDPGAPPS